MSIHNAAKESGADVCNPVAKYEYRGTCDNRTGWLCMYNITSEAYSPKPCCHGKAGVFKYYQRACACTRVCACVCGLVRVCVCVRARACVKT